MTRKDDRGAVPELDKQAELTRALISPRLGSQLTASGAETPARISMATEDALRTIAAALDQLAAAYIVSIRSRVSSSR